MNRTKRRQPMEYVGGLKFPAQEYDLSSIPDNDRAGRDAAAMMPWVRLAALFLHENDDQLEAKVRASSDAEGMSDWMDTLEGIGAVLDAKQQDAKMLEVGFTRLLVAIERVVGRDAIKAAYSKPSDEDDARKHLAGIRSRLHRRATFKPRLVTGGGRQP